MSGSNVLVEVEYLKFITAVKGSIGRKVSEAVAMVLVKVGYRKFIRTVSWVTGRRGCKGSSEFGPTEIHQKCIDTTKFFDARLF